MDTSHAGSTLRTLLGLRHTPVAIAFREAAPEGLRRLSGPASCSYWSLAADGEVFYTEAADHLSCPVGAHTHGGQVNFPIFGRPIETSKLGYVAGHIEERGRHIFVTTGIGTSIMGVRFGVPPEIVILNLTPGDARTP